jgi:hypothetical protein
MNLHDAATPITSSQERHHEADTRLHGRWLLIARVGWMVLTLLILTLNAVMIPRYNAILQAQCQPGPQCFAIQLTAHDQQFLHQLGLSLGFVAAFRVMLDAVSVLVCCTIRRADLLAQVC